MSRRQSGRSKPSSSVSPVGWYLGSHVLRLVELDEGSSDDPDERYLAWENTVIVQSPDMERAFRSVEKIARRASRPYLAGDDGRRVQWQFVGITELLPIYEEIAHGAEIAWRERPRTKLATLKKMVRSLESLSER